MHRLMFTCVEPTTTKISAEDESLVLLSLDPLDEDNVYVPLCCSVLLDEHFGCKLANGREEALEKDIRSGGSQLGAGTMAALPAIDED